MNLNEARQILRQNGYIIEAHVMNRAKQAKDDEFYTKYKDVEKEMVHYNFSGKVVYCCCDNPEWSQVYKYFKDNYKKLGLKGLISSHLDNETYSTHYDGIEEIKTPMKSNGDCTNSECKALAAEADIIVTNPPFSIFADIVNTYKNKPFIMLCTQAKMVCNKTIWNLYLNKKIHYGYTGIGTFYRPNGEKDKHVQCLWYTNIPVNKQYKKLNLVELDESFEKYDNYDAYEASWAKVPYTDEIIGLPVSVIKNLDPNNLPFYIIERNDKLVLNGKKMFTRLLVKLKGV